MKKRYWIIGIIVVVIAAVAAYLLFGKQKKTAIEWRTAKIEKGDIQITVRASGTLSADTTVQVGTQVSGIINKINVDFNSVVKKGQVIAILDTTFLAQAVDDARATLKRAQISVNQSKRDFDRTKVLFDQKVLARPTRNGPFWGSKSRKTCATISTAAPMYPSAASRPRTAFCCSLAPQVFNWPTSWK